MGEYVVLIDGLTGGRAEGDELVGNDPVQISIFDLLVMLVFREVERLVVEPAQSHRILESAQAIQQLNPMRITVHL